MVRHFAHHDNIVPGNKWCVDSVPVNRFFIRNETVCLSDTFSSDSFADR